jgi:hypothetical protein
MAKKAVKRRHEKKLCKSCGNHRALFSYRGGAVHGDKRHTLCFRCFKSLHDSAIARQVNEED